MYAYASLALLVALDLADPVTPRLEIEATSPLEAQARSLAETDPRVLAGLAQRLGLATAGAPIRVELLDESTPAAREAEPWIYGWAYGALSTVVLLAEREPSYPDGSLEELLRHEVVHVLAHRAAGGRDLPRWFDEGVALELSRPWGLDDRSRLSLALLLNERVPIASLDRRFAGGRGEVQRAYAVSGALVRELQRAFGPGTIAAILSGRAAGLGFEEAFLGATGAELSGFETGFWRRYSLWYRWLPLVTSSFALWLFVLALALWAAAARRRRRAVLEEAWEREAGPGDGEGSIN